MSFPLRVLRQTRRNMLAQCEPLDLERLNAIPAGFNNNLIWNVGHCLATHQLLCYGLGGQSPKLPADFIARYRRGTFPDGQANGAEWSFIRERLLSSVDTFEEDLRRLDFSNFKKYETSYGTTLTNVGQALSFNNVHEGMHFGTVLALRKLV